METPTVLYSFVGTVTTPQGARLTASGTLRAPAGFPKSAYAAAADATADLIGHRPNPASGVKLSKVNGSEIMGGITLAVSVACDVWGVTQSELFSRARTERLNKPRFAVYSYLRNQCGLSFPDVARLMGRRDHATIIHGVKTLKGWAEVDATLRAQVAEFNRRLDA